MTSRMIKIKKAFEQKNKDSHSFAQTAELAGETTFVIDKHQPLGK